VDLKGFGVFFLHCYLVRVLWVVARALLCSRLWFRVFLLHFYLVIVLGGC